MAIYTLNFSNVLKYDTNLYNKFINRYVCLTFQKPTNVDIVQLYNTNYADLNLIPDAVVLEQNSLPIFDWGNLIAYNTNYVYPFDSTVWNIPTTGNSAYVSKFNFNSNEHYAIFGIFDATGTLNRSLGLLGKDFNVTISTTLGSFNITNMKIESYPYTLTLNGTNTIPCETVVTKYNGNGIFPITL